MVKNGQFCSFLTFLPLPPEIDKMGWVYLSVQFDDDISNLLTKNNNLKGQNQEIWTAVTLRGYFGVKFKNHPTSKNWF